MKLKNLYLPVVVALLLVTAACQSGQKVTAQAAITAAQTAFGPVKAAAEKYVPDQTAAVEASINQAQTAYNNGDYAGALASAPKRCPDKSPISPPPPKPRKTS